MLSKRYRALMVLCSFVWLCSLSGVGSAADTVRDCDIEPTDMVIGYGEFLTGDNCIITSGGEVDLFRFDAAAGDYVLLSVGDGNSNYYLNPCFEVRDPSNQVVVANGCTPNANKRTIDFTIPSSGRYLILVREDSSDAVQYGLNLDRLNPPTTSSDLVPCYGCQLDESIDARGDTDPYLLSGSAGDEILITLIDRSSNYYVNPCVSLRTPDGMLTPNGARRCTPNSSVATIEETLPETGVYTIVVDEDSSDATPFGLDVQCLFGPCAGPEPISTGALDVDGNGTFDALTDGLLILRYAFGLSGNALTVDAIDDDGCLRCSAAEIEAYLDYVTDLTVDSP